MRFCALYGGQLRDGSSRRDGRHRRAVWRRRLGAVARALRDRRRGVARRGRARICVDQERWHGGGVGDVLQAQSPRSVANCRSLGACHELEAPGLVAEGPEGGKPDMSGDRREQSTTVLHYGGGCWVALSRLLLAWCLPESMCSAWWASHSSIEQPTQRPRAADVLGLCRAGVGSQPGCGKSKSFPWPGIHCTIGLPSHR